MGKGLIIGTLFLLLLSGCQERTVHKVADSDQSNAGLSQSVSVKEPVSPNSSKTSGESAQVIAEPIDPIASEQPSDMPNTAPETASDSTSDSENVINQDDNAPDIEEPIIIAKSEDLSDLDETTIILNEIDDLLDQTLNNLDQLEEDTLSNDNIVTQGGIK